MLAKYSSLLLLVLASASAIAVTVGCKNQAQQISNSGRLLDQQHQLWREVLASCKANNPDLRRIRSLGGYLGARTRVRAEKDYTGQNRQQVLDLLSEIGAEYQASVLDKLVVEEHNVRLREGVTLEDVGKSVLAMEPKYQKLLGLTK